MFFPERIKGITPNFKVLEIGPGADPHPRADVLLEMRFEDPAMYTSQFGHDRQLRTEKPVVFYDGGAFPFADKEFDYVICSHVIEHVPDVEAFLAELFRIATRGYLEYPTIHYEYLFNFDVHLNYVHFTNGELKYMPKRDAPLDRFKPVQEAFVKTLAKGHVQLIQAMPDHFFQGFEWNASFPVTRSIDVQELCDPNWEPPVATEVPPHKLGVKRMYKELIRAVAAKLTSR